MLKAENFKKEYEDDYCRDTDEKSDLARNSNRGFKNKATLEKAIKNRNHREFDGAIMITEKRIKAINAISARNLGRVVPMWHLAELIEKETGKPLKLQYLRILIQKYSQYLKITVPERGMVYFGEEEDYRNEVEGVK